MIDIMREFSYADIQKEEIHMTLGQRLQKARKESGLSQEELADQLGVSRQAVSKWENGISDPSTSNLIALAKLYGLSAEHV